MIGSGPAGQHAALRAARDRRRVALIEQRQVLGGGCLHTGTIPSKTLREAVLYFTGYRLHSVYGSSYRLKDRITMDDLTFRVQHVIRRELDTIATQMRRNGIDLYYGTACFESPQTVRVEGVHTSTRLRGEKFGLAVGSKPAHPAPIPFMAGRIFDGDGILQLPVIPRSMVVVGAGIIGCEYGSIFCHPRYRSHPGRLPRSAAGFRRLRDCQRPHVPFGQAVMTCESPIEYFVNTVFNYPTLAEAYKIAAFDGLDKL